MDNLVKIRNIVEELTIRDEKLIERSKILEELFLKSPQAIAYGFQCPTQMVGKCHYELFKSIPERPIDEINEGLTEKGFWKGIIKCPHKSNDSFLCEVIIKSVEEKDMLVWTCVKVTK